MTGNFLADTLIGYGIGILLAVFVLLPALRRWFP